MLLLLEHIVLQHFPSFGHLSTFGFFYALPQEPAHARILDQFSQLPTAMDEPLVSPMLVDTFDILDFKVGPMPTLHTCSQCPALLLYRLFPYHAILQSYALGSFDAVTWTSEKAISQQKELSHYLTHACAFHSSWLVSWLWSFKTDDNAAFCDAAIDWLTKLRTTYYDGPRPLWPALAFQAAAHPVSTPASVTPSAKPSYADKVATPCAKPPTLPLAVLLSAPNKPKFKATIKGTCCTRIYSHVPASAQACLLSMHHSNKVLYPAVLSAASKLPLAASLLDSNPITRVFWSANGQFIIVQFKDDVSDDIYHLFTSIFSDFYGTAVDHQHYMRKEASSFVKWTSCPTFDQLGNAILAQQYLDIIKDMPWFKNVKILGLPELISAKHPDGAHHVYNGSGTYCTLKLCIKDNTKGNILNSIINKPVILFG